MSAIEESDDAVRRAGRIVARSVMVTTADLVVRRSAASLRSSRALTLAGRCQREFQSLPSGERTRCALIALSTALAGHIVLASLLPVPARPMLALTTVALIGAIVVVIARSAK
jgi:hypothetical protein